MTTPLADPMPGWPYPPPAPPQQPNTLAVVAGVLGPALGIVGLVLSSVSVTVLSGDTVLWVAAALAVAGSFIAWMVPHVKVWARVVAAVLAMLVLVNALYVDQKLNQRRDQIQQQLQQVGQASPSRLSHQAVEAYIVNALGEWVLCNNGRDFVMHRAGEQFQCTPTTSGGATSYTVTITNPRTGAYVVS